MPFGEMRVEFDGYAIDLWPLALALFALLLIFVGWRTRRFSYLLCCAVFGLYLLVVAQLAFFPLWISGGYAEAMRQDRQLIHFINVIPFYFGPYGSTFEDSFVTLAQNVALTVPLGFGVNFVRPIRARRMLVLALAVGLGLEGVQLVISLLLGYPYRFIDINDTITNALGVLIGYAVFRLFAWAYVAATERFGLRHRGLTAYVDRVARRA